MQEKNTHNFSTQEGMNSHPVLCCDLPPLLHLLRQEFLDSLLVGERSKLVLKVSPGLQEHQTFLLLLTALHTLIGLLKDLSASLYAVVTVNGQLKLAIADPDLQYNQTGIKCIRYSFRMSMCWRNFDGLLWHVEYALTVSYKVLVCCRILLARSQSQCMTSTAPDVNNTKEKQLRITFNPVKPGMKQQSDMFFEMKQFIEH